MSRVREAVRSGDTRLKHARHPFRAQLLNIFQIAALKAEHRKQLAASQVKEAELQDARKQLQDCGEEAQRREDLLAKLREQVAKLEVAPNRASYTRKILDIVSNIKKQKVS